MNETRYPLCWPGGWKRITKRDTAKFGKQETSSTKWNDGTSTTYTNKKRVTVADSLQRVFRELRAMSVSDYNVIVSTNVETRMDGLPYSNRSEPHDPGAAVYWKDKQGRRKCMAIDRYDRVADNLAAIAATLDAMRAIQRHGGAEILERTFLGFAQIPEKAGKSWREVLGFAGDATPSIAMIHDHFRSRAAEAHPDTKGSHERMVELNAARVAALAEVA